MRATLVSLASSALLAVASPEHASSRQCKAFPGSSSWPSPKKWMALNETLGGQLIKPVPPGGVCHRDAPNYDKAECPSVQKGWETYDFHAADPVSSMWDNWSNYTCLPDLPNATCTGNGYPSYVINATTPKHVQQGVNFGKQRRLFSVSLR